MIYEGYKFNSRYIITQESSLEEANFNQIEQLVKKIRIWALAIDDNVHLDYI